MVRGAMRALDLPETEAPHLGVSSGGVEVEGTVFVRASLTGNGSPSSGRQLGRGGSGREGVEVGGVCQICRTSCMTSCMATCQLSGLSVPTKSTSPVQHKHI